jgi:MYXO-CTERM domain-containing protein
MKARWLAALIVASPQIAAAQDVVLEDVVSEDGGDHLLVPFEVPAGVVEMEIVHDDLSEENILDWGLYGPGKVFRGYGGGNTEPAVVGVEASSRSYLTGPIEAGTWYVHVGKAKLVESPAQYHIEIYFRDTPTLAPQVRKPYAPAELETGARWYAGDFHVHSLESGDAAATLDEIADLARSRGLDFVALSEHNTTSALDFLVDAQARHPDVLFVPSVEFTTYGGHANAFGATEWVDHKIGLEGVTIAAAAQAFADQGTIFTINHPALFVGDLCIGCGWEHELDPALIGGVEIATGAWSVSGKFFGHDAIAFWDSFCVQGFHVAALGGSDDHRAGVDLGVFGSPIGSPTTMVYAESLSAAALIAGIRNGRTVVMLEGSDDPMIELSSSIAAVGDTVAAQRTTLRARVTGGAGNQLVFVVDGVDMATMPITSDDFTGELTTQPPAEGQSRVRAEVWLEGTPRTVTSHLWLVWGEAGGDEGCGCRVTGAPAQGGAWLLLLALVSLRRCAQRRA